MLHWPPDAFWRASLVEFFAAIEGHNKANRPGNAVEPVSSEEAKEMFEAEERRLARLRLAGG